MASRRRPSRPAAVTAAGRPRAGAGDRGELRPGFADWFDFVPVGLLTLNAAGIVREINPRAASMLAVERRRVVGLALAGFLADRSLFRQRLAECKRDDVRASTSVELVLLPRHQPPITVQLLIRRVRTGYGYQVAMMEVTDRVRLLAAEQAGRSASETRDTFIAMLSHELRTPLTPVLAAAAALRGGDLSSREIQRSCAIIERNVALQARLIDDLLDISRVVRGKMRLEVKPVAIHPLIEEVVQMVADEMQAKEQSLVVDLGASRQTVTGDPVRLRQVFWNLLRNAVKFTPRGGAVTVKSWNNGARLVLEIQDTGPGLASDTIEELFQPFHQGANAAAGGLGLGLAIARAIAELHDGKIIASNRGPGNGACFIVDLPVVLGLTVATTVENVSSLVVTSLRASRGIKILLVEDNRDTAESFCRLLTAQGFTVEIAGTLREALKVDLATVSLVISDVGLPDGDGRTLLRRLRRRRKVKAIALSGYGAEADVRSSLEAGFSAHLVKPIAIPSLIAAIHKALDD